MIKGERNLRIETIKIILYNDKDGSLNKGKTRSIDRGSIFSLIRKAGEINQPSAASGLALRRLLLMKDRFIFRNSKEETKTKFLIKQKVIRKQNTCMLN